MFFIHARISKQEYVRTCGTAAGLSTYVTSLRQVAPNRHCGTASEHPERPLNAPRPVGNDRVYVCTYVRT